MPREELWVVRSWVEEKADKERKRGSEARSGNLVFILSGREPHVKDLKQSSDI